MIRKAILVIIAILAVFWFITDPHGFGSAVHSFVSHLASSADSFVKAI